MNKHLKNRQWDGENILSFTYISTVYGGFSIFKAFRLPCLLMYGTRLMGESLQQLAGDRLRHILDSLTTNRFTSLLTGALVTAMIQSSTAASLMTVSFVHAGMLTLVQALPILMGASVGNTFIAWIMAAEFNFSISNYIYPLILVAFIMT